jgi:hypothetical protein
MTAEAAELTAAREEIKRLRATTKRPRCTYTPGTCSANPPPAKCHPHDDRRKPGLADCTVGLGIGPIVADEVVDQPSPETGSSRDCPS